MISIIVIVKNDRSVSDTLHHLTSLVIKPENTEIIVVDASEERLNDIKHKYQKKVNWIQFSPIAGKKITIPRQRNVGIKTANGNVIVFIDASCIPNRDWLVKITQPIIDGFENIVCGRTGSKGDKTLHDQTHELRKNAQYIDECATINLAVNKSVFDAVGEFDEAFEYGSDVDFIWRAIDKGYKIRYLPEAYIEHDWGNFIRDMKRSFIYGKARARLYKKHKHRKKNLFKKDIVAIIYPLYLLFLPVCIIFPYYLLFLLIPLLKNINKNPILTTIDHFCYALGVLTEILYARQKI